VLSSLTNFAVSVLAARQLSPEGFGSFALAMVLYFVAVGVTRALCGDVLLVRHSRNHTDEAALGSMSAAVGIGLVGALLVVVVAVFADADARPVLLALAVTLPLLCLQDTLRFVFIAAARGEMAFANDGVWAASQLVVLGTLVLWFDPTSWSLLLGWGLSAGVAAIVGLLQTSGWPAPWRAWAWLDRGRDLWPRFLGEFAATMGAWQVVLLGVGGIAGLTTLAAIRGCQVVFGPLHVANIGARLIAVPEGARAEADARRAVVLAARTALVLMALAALWTLVLLVLPDAFGIALLGETWPLTQGVLLPFGIFMAGEAAIFGAGIALRVLADAAAALRAALASATVLLLAGLSAAWFGDLATIGWALAASGVVGAIVWWAVVVCRTSFGEPQPVRPERKL